MSWTFLLSQHFTFSLSPVCEKKESVCLELRSSYEKAKNKSVVLLANISKDSKLDAMQKLDDARGGLQLDPSILQSRQTPGNVALLTSDLKRWTHLANSSFNLCLSSCYLYITSHFKSMVRFLTSEFQRHFEWNISTSFFFFKESNSASSCLF